MASTSQNWLDLSGSRDCVFEQNILIGTGLRAYGATGLRADNNSILDVSQAFDFRGGTASLSGNAVSNRVPIDPGYPTSRSYGGPTSRSYGYAPASSPAVPSQCPQCKAIFPSRNYVFTSYKLYLNRTPNIETCPNCGCGEAVVAEGVFDLSREMIRILSGPASTYALVEVFAGIARRAASGELSLEQAAQEVAVVHPEVGGILRGMFQYGVPAVLFAVAVLGALASYVTIQQYADENPAFMGGLLSRVPTLITEEQPEQQGIPNDTQDPGARPASEEAACEPPSAELQPNLKPDCAREVRHHVTRPPSGPKEVRPRKRTTD